MTPENHFLNLKSHHFSDQKISFNIPQNLSNNHSNFIVVSEIALIRQCTNRLKYHPLRRIKNLRVHLVQGGNSKKHHVSGHSKIQMFKLKIKFQKKLLKSNNGHFIQMRTTTLTIPQL